MSTADPADCGTEEDGQETSLGQDVRSNLVLIQAILYNTTVHGKSKLCITKLYGLVRETIVGLRETVPSGARESSSFMGADDFIP